MSFGQMSFPTCFWSLSTAITHLFLTMYTSPSLSYWEAFPCIKVKLSQGVFRSFYPLSPKYGRKSVHFLCSNFKKPKPVLKLFHLPLSKEFLMGYFLAFLIPFLAPNCPEMQSPNPYTELERSIISTKSWRTTLYIIQQLKRLPAKGTGLSGFPFLLSHPLRAAQHD